MHRNNYILARFAAAAVLFTTLMTFQNCSQVDFAPSELQLTSEGWTRTENLTVQTTADSEKVDILFILDESASMGSVVQNVQRGFASIDLSTFSDKDVLMGVSNTAPAHSSADGLSFDPLKDYMGNRADLFIIDQPGFLRLVTKDSISSFVAAHSNFINRFAVKGCNQEWFRLSDVDQDGQPCFKGASQIALQGTGVEAGITALAQLASHKQNNGQRLFREGALVNIVFVSDTHDAGVASYYGRPGAPAQMKTPSELTAALTSANPGLAGIQYHGIVPLPVAGDSKLEGVNVLGDLPATVDTTGEGTWNYTYLPFVRQTGGVATHFRQDDWSNVSQRLARAAKIAQNPVIRLAHQANGIVSINVNGQFLDASAYTLIDNGHAVQLQNQSWPNEVSVSIEYTDSMYNQQ